MTSRAPPFSRHWHGYDHAVGPGWWRMVRSWAWSPLLIVIVAGTLVACSDGRSAGTSASAAHPRITVVSQNLLHGNACAPDSNRCDLPDRVELFVRQLRDAG